MKVRNKRKKIKQKFIVGVEKFDYAEDFSMQIIKWWKKFKILGANNVEFSILNVHKNDLDILKFLLEKKIGNKNCRMNLLHTTTRFMRIYTPTTT